MKHRILLVEDEKNFGAVLKDYLQLNGFVVTLCDDGIKGLDAFEHGKFDLLILDVMMPKKDGFTLAEEIRQINRHIPILFLTAKALREDVIKGYKVGADDYIIKPFDTEVLLYKLKAILNRKEIEEKAPETLHQIGSMEFNYKLRTIRYPDAKEVKLSPKEAELLNLLCNHKDDVLPRSKALKMIWKEDNYFTGRSMDVFIVKLRKYLQVDNSIEIASLHGNGYRLVEK
jgi:two-component system, OmpR family, response regulator